MTANTVDGDQRGTLQQRHGRNYVRLLNLLAAGQIALYLTTALWVPPFRFPEVPLWSTLRDWPVWVNVAAFAGSLAGTFFAKQPEDRRSRRLRHGMCAVSFALLFSFNQHRLQPWAWQFFILHAWLALSRPQWRLTGWRWLTISIYVYSALSKFDVSFCRQHGPFLWDGFLHACGFAAGTEHWPSSWRFAGAILMPVTELCAAMCLCFQNSQRWGLALSVTMHLFLIVALGPWGHDHSAGVLIWNVYFIVQNWLLFSIPDHVFASGQWPERAMTASALPGDAPSVKTAGVIAGCVLTVALLAPLGELWGLWDHWPSWAVYAARPAVTKVFIHEDDLPRVPQELQSYVQPPATLEPWHRFRIDRWSLEAAKVPINPQERFHIGVALALAERCQLTTLRVTIDSPPDRWTGTREHREFVGIDAVREQAAAYWLNALPRSFQ